MPNFSKIINIDVHEMFSNIDVEKHRVPHYDREQFIRDMKHIVYVESRELTDAQFNAVEKIYIWLLDQIFKLDKKNGLAFDPVLVSIIPEFVPLDDVVETDDIDIQTNKLVKYRNLCPLFTANHQHAIDQVELDYLYNVGFGEDPKDCARRNKLYNMLLAYKAQLDVDQELIANVLKPKKKRVSVPASKPKSKSGVFKHTSKSSNKITSFFKKISSK